MQLELVQYHLDVQYIQTKVRMKTEPHRFDYAEQLVASFSHQVHINITRNDYN